MLTAMANKKALTKDPTHFMQCTDIQIKKPNFRADFDLFFLTFQFVYIRESLHVDILQSYYKFIEHTNLCIIYLFSWKRKDIHLSDENEYIKVSTDESEMPVYFKSELLFRLEFFFKKMIFFYTYTSTNPN